MNKQVKGEVHMKEAKEVTLQAAKAVQCLRLTTNLTCINEAH